jgi:hypothetical protein
MSADGKQLIGEMFQSPVLVQNATMGIWELVPSALLWKIDVAVLQAESQW